jgi:hypothetical protein
MDIGESFLTQFEDADSSVSAGKRPVLWSKNLFRGHQCPWSKVSDQIKRRHFFVGQGRKGEPMDIGDPFLTQFEDADSSVSAGKGPVLWSKNLFRGHQCHWMLTEAEE